MNNKRFSSSLTHVSAINHENSRDFNLYCFLYTSHISAYLWSLANISRISLRSRTSSEGSSGAGSSMGLSFFRWKLLIAFTTVKIIFLTHSSLLGDFNDYIFFVHFQFPFSHSFDFRFGSPVIFCFTVTTAHFSLFHAGYFSASSQSAHPDS